MRFRTKLFLASSLVVLLLWAGTLWPTQRIIASSFDRMADVNFAAARQSLRGLQEEQISRMRQAGVMVMQIPGLRGLIADKTSELTAGNGDSLQERLDSLTEVIGVKFFCVLDGSASLIAQNSTSPWTTLGELNDYLSHSPQARPLINRLFTSPGSTKELDRGEYGLWVHDGQLLQVVGLRLVFSSDTDKPQRPDGALVMASPITDNLARGAAWGDRCQISFLTTGSVLATTLPNTRKPQLIEPYRNGRWPWATPFDLRLGGVPYRAYLETLADPCSGTTIGATLIQSSLADGTALGKEVSKSLLAIMSAGLTVAALISFLLSSAVTRPVRELVQAVSRVAQGDVNWQIDVVRRDELGELELAFNDMVNQLRSRLELERVVECSQAASRAKSQFLANMSHEFRTPLHGIIGMANLLLSTPLEERQRRYADLVKSSAELLGRLINDILDFSKIEAGKLELEVVEFDLPVLADEVVELLHQKAADKGVTMACQIGQDVPTKVHGDANRLRQIMMNLISNAVKFTSAGRVDVTVKRERAAEDGVILRFAVRDTGIGIPADRMDRLFQSFSQVDSSTTRRFGGTGLGLAISKQLAELMGGEMGVESRPGEGSTFWFTIVVKEVKGLAVPSAQRSTKALPEPEKPTTRRRILVAEDNEINQIVARDVLSNGGYEFVVVADGQAAVRAFVDGQFDLILMDCQMPVMDGFEATAAIRQHEENARAGEAKRRVPIIALTANASGADREQCRKIGMDGYCAKPFRPAELLAAISAFLADAPPAEPPPLDVKDLLARCSGSAEMAATILDKFQKQAGEAIENLERSLSAEDGASIARLSHALKSTAGVVAAETLRRELIRMEDAGKTNALEAARTCLQSLRAEVNRCAFFIPTAKAELGRAAAPK